MQKQERQTIVIDINLTRGLVTLLSLALLAVALLSYMAWGQQKAAASGTRAPLAQSTGLRQFYLDGGSYDGAETTTVCASGYHFASLWEILDTSNLKYNTTLGWTNDDSGQGPPVLGYGWVRTGYSNSTANTAGEGNCNGWSSNSNSDYGTSAYRPSNWTTGQDIYVWKVETGTCDVGRSVWCVED